MMNDIFYIKHLTSPKSIDEIIITHVSRIEKAGLHIAKNLKWTELERGLEKGGVIDDNVQSQIVKAAQKGKQIFERITAAVQTLAQQNLDFRGHRESLGNDENPESFLALMKFLAKLIHSKNTWI